MQKCDRFDVNKNWYIPTHSDTDVAIPSHHTERTTGQFHCSLCAANALGDVSVVHQTEKCKLEGGLSA